MDKNVWKQTIAFSLLFAAGATYAGTMGLVCTPQNVTVPCQQPTWEFGAQALYLQPSTSGTPYIGGTASPTTVGSNYISNNFNWGWGFLIEGGYHFGMAQDINLNWYHWQKVTQHSFVASQMTMDDMNFGGNIQTALRPQWDAANVEFGKRVSFDSSADVRLHAGIQYARIVRQKLINSNQSYASNATTLTDVPGHYNRHSTYNGFGPRIGADLAYSLYDQFRLYAKTAGALLVGPQGFNTVLQGSYIYSQPPINIKNKQYSSANGSITAVVPEIEAKLGVIYTYTINNNHLSLDAGWLWVNYFDVLHYDDSYADARTTNFGIQGLYFGLKWVGNLV